MDTIYVESSIKDHPRARKILSRFSSATVIDCDRYGEVFNPRAQNFRLQKRRPSLILAEKTGRRVLETPPDYSIGRTENHYFSHMLNCLYDCRYCFLQGMYQSANYVLFVNWEDFEEELEERRRESGGNGCFFSGYDCDSLAMESLTGFVEHFLPFFGERPDAWLELRTKSLNTRTLEQFDPLSNVIIAYTLTPDAIAREIEHGAPPFEKRLRKAASLAEKGWRVGFRFDPLIPWPAFETLYREMIETIFGLIDPGSVHSATLGPMRFPKAMYERIRKLYPEDPLFALEEMSLRDGQITYPVEIETELVATVEKNLQEHLPESRIFRQGA